MKYHLVLSCFVAISAFLFSTAYSVTITPSYAVKESKTVYIIKKKFELVCNVTDNTDNEPLVWKREKKILTDEFKGRNTTETKGISYKFRVWSAGDADIGNYSCAVGTQEVEFQVVTKIYVKVESYINVVEGETLKIKCETRGKPPPKLSWEFKNDTYNATYDNSTERVKLDTFEGVANGLFIMENIQKYDRGIYTCIGHPVLTPEQEKARQERQEKEDEVVKASCTVRIKDKYAALWPFLGICAEVFILCLIIFIYEKKRNKTELEESDTDQSPDQKNTPDHGKESNLRHRQ